MSNNLKIVEYGNSKNHYAILEEKALMKNPETKEWVECVIYKQHKTLVDGEYVPVPEEEKLTFVREYYDFWSKFTLCLDL